MLFTLLFFSFLPPFYLFLYLSQLLGLRTTQPVKQSKLKKKSDKNKLLSRSIKINK